MLTFRRTGSPGAVLAAHARSVPTKIIPYAASTALTRVAQYAQQQLVARLPQTFDRPTRYTLNSTRIVPSTVQTLTARVAVKDQTPGRAPEAYLLPQVRGGDRPEKAFERALRYAGVLRSGERAMPGAAAPLDASGNLSAAFVRQILAAVAGRQAAKRQSKRAAAQGRAMFAGEIRGQRGVWQRDGRRVRPLLIFTSATPRYRPRLDFEAEVRRAAEERFEAEFLRAADAIANR